MKLDFLDRLIDKVDRLGLYPQYVLNGLLSEKESIATALLPGGTEKVYMDGARDKTLNVQFLAKHIDQMACINALNTIAFTLENLEALSSENESFEFSVINVTSNPSFVTQDEQGFYIYQLSIAAEITIENGVDM